MEYKSKKINCVLSYNPQRYAPVRESLTNEKER